MANEDMGCLPGAAPQARRRIHVEQVGWRKRGLASATRGGRQKGCFIGGSMSTGDHITMKDSADSASSALKPSLRSRLPRRRGDERARGDDSNAERAGHAEKFFKTARLD